MKKAYITPAMEMIEINAVSILAASSLSINSSHDAVNTSAEGVQLGREDNPSTPNLWDQEW